MASSPPPLVTSKQEAIDNIIAYNLALARSDALPVHVSNSLLNTISMGQSWFAINVDAEWLVGPVKYIGHRCNPRTYETHRQVMNGTAAETNVRTLAGKTLRNVPPDHPAMTALEDLAVMHAKHRRKTVRMSILHVGPLTAQPPVPAAPPIVMVPDQKRVDAILTLTTLLTADEISLVKTGIAAL